MTTDTIYHRHRRWSADGTWARILDELRRGADQNTEADHGPEWSVGVDSTVVRAHQHAAPPGQRPGSCSVEVLAAYSHSVQAADLRLCRTVALTNPVGTPRPSAKRPWSLRDRLDERDIAELITAYRDGATAASLAAAHGLSLKSVKRLLHIAGVRRTPATRRSTKATPTATHL